MSSRSGTPVKTTSPEHSKLAAIMGSVEFLDPLILTWPLSGFEPLTTR